MRTRKEWIEFENRLAQARLDAINNALQSGYTEISLDALSNAKREVEIRQFVMDNFETPEVLNGSAEMWYNYMVEQAALHDQHVTGQIMETEFYVELESAQRKRDMLDRLLSDCPWLRE